MNDKILEFTNFLTVEKRHSRHTVDAYRRRPDPVSPLSHANGAAGNVTPAEIRAFLTHLAEQGQSPASIARALSSLKSYFHFVAEEAENRNGRQSGRTSAISQSRASPAAGGLDEAGGTLLAALQGHATWNPRQGHAGAALRHRASGFRAGFPEGDRPQPGSGFLRSLGKGSKERVVPIGSVALDAVRLYSRSGPARFHQEQPAGRAVPHPPGQGDDAAGVLGNRSKPTP